MRENQHFVDAQGQTPLHIAVAASQIQAVETLVRKCPAWISAKDLPPHSHYICLSYFVHSKHCQGNGTNGSVKKHQKKTMLECFCLKKTMQICRTSEEEHLWIWHGVKDWRRFSIRRGQRKHWESLRAVLLTVALDFTAAAEPDSLSFTCFYYITYFLAAICL